MLPERSLDLDVDSPEKVARVLRDAADQYRNDARKLDSAWQDNNAGKPWRRIAQSFDRMATTIERNLGVVVRGRTVQP